MQLSKLNYSLCTYLVSRKELQELLLLFSDVIMGA